LIIAGELSANSTPRNPKPVIEVLIVASSVYAKKITFEVVSKGRKYFRIRYSPEHNEFQLLINEISNTFQVGQRIEDLLCEFETDKSYSRPGSHTKTTAIPVSADELAARQAAVAATEKQAAIKKWCGYCEDALSEGRIYERAFTELRALGFDLSVYAEQIAQVQEQQNKQKIAQWCGYCETAALEGRDYARGYEILRGLGATAQVTQYQEQARQVREQQLQAEQVDREQQRQVEAAQGIVEYWFGSPTWSSRDEQTHLQVGDLYQDRKTGDWYKILTRKYNRIREDGLSFGLSDDAGEEIFGKARLATPEEAAPRIAAQEQERAEREAKQARAVERTALIAAIKSHPEVTCPKHNAGELLLSTVNLYGGGDWFEVDESSGQIWYCLNNGHDSDDWSQNNVSTWGAGAIGWRVPYDAGIAVRIAALIATVAEIAQSETPPVAAPIPATPSANHREIAERIAELINACDDYSASVWDQPDTHTRVYVTTTCRKRKDCGFVKITDAGNIVRCLTRQGGTIERLYWDATVDQALGGSIDG
jgi:hypothetical protein